MSSNDQPVKTHPGLPVCPGCKAWLADARGAQEKPPCPGLYSRHPVAEAKAARAAGAGDGAGLAGGRAGGRAAGRKTCQPHTSRGA